jgi:hypothetical protein
MPSDSGSSVKATDAQHELGVSSVPPEPEIVIGPARWQTDAAIEAMFQRSE